MLQRPSWKRASVSGKIELIRSHYVPGHSASGLASSITKTTGEMISRSMVIGVYTRRPYLRISHPLSGVPGAKGTAAKQKLTPPPRVVREKDDLPRLQASPVIIEHFTPEEARAYDEAAPGVTVLAVTNRECRWPVREGLFCGHPAQGRYCHHHTLRSRRDG